MSFKFLDISITDFFSRNPEYDCSRTRDFLKVLAKKTEGTVNALVMAELYSDIYEVYGTYQRFPITPDFTQKFLEEICTLASENQVKEVRGVMEDLATCMWI